MNRIYQLAAALLYIVLFYCLFPLYRYVLDIDAISYIHVAERMAKGEYYYAVNGYWSPLISWILVPFIKAGYDPVLSAKYINGVLGLLCFFSCCSLMDKFNIHSILKRIVPFVLAVLLVSYSFYELCADLLQLFLLLAYLHLVFSPNFIRDTGKIIFAGILGGLCYYAKAYSFPFFLSHFIIVAFILLKKEGVVNIRATLIKKTAIAFVAFFLLVTPYILLLGHKYGSPRISTASQLNMSWFLSPGLSDNRKLVAEPPFPDGTSYWDEPYYSQEKFITPFTSFHYFIKEIQWTFSNTVKFSGMLSFMSIFSYLILLGFIIYLFRRKKDSEANEQVLFVTSLLYPAGYLLIFIEWRYVWILPIAFLLMGAILLSRLFEQGFFSRKLLVLAGIILSLSFIHQPLKELKDLKNSNKDVFEIADIFKQNNISGNIFLNYKSFPPYGKTIVLSYLTQSKLYGPLLLDYTFDELMAAAKKHHIDYYLYYYDFPVEKEIFLQSPYAKAGIKVFDNLYPGLIVVQLK